MKQEYAERILGKYVQADRSQKWERISEQLERVRAEGETLDREYQKFIMERFYNTVEEWNGYGENTDMWLLLFSPEIYGVEDEMLQYVKENPKLTMREYAAHFRELAAGIELEDEEEKDEE